MKKFLIPCLLLSFTLAQAQSKAKTKGPSIAANKTVTIDDGRKVDKKSLRKEKREARKETREKATKQRRYYIDANGTKTYVEE